MEKIGTQYLAVLFVLLATTSCASYEEQTKVESTLTQSLERFHEQLNNAQFHDIYIEADSSLRQRIDEVAFTNQLKNAHDQLGRVSGGARVLLTSKAWNDLRWARFFGREQLVFHTDLAHSDLINASERFQWRLENDQPKLHSYEFRFICRRPCTVGFGP